MLTTEGITRSTTGAKPSCQLMFWAWAVPASRAKNVATRRLRRIMSCSTSSNQGPGPGYSLGSLVYESLEDLDGTHGQVRQAGARSRGYRLQALRQRAGTADLRQHLPGSMALLAGTLQDDRQRVSPRSDE